MADSFVVSVAIIFHPHVASRLAVGLIRIVVLVGCCVVADSSFVFVVTVVIVVVVTVVIMTTFTHQDEEFHAHG